MKSESMRRFHVEHMALGDDNGARSRSAEIERQTREFLATGGEIQQVPNHVGTNPVFRFSMGPADKVGSWQ